MFGVYKPYPKTTPLTPLTPQEVMNANAVAEEQQRSTELASAFKPRTEGEAMALERIQQVCVWGGHHVDRSTSFPRDRSEAGSG